jgi:hypothetical protein
MATPTTLPASFTAGQVLTAAQMNDLRGAFRVLQVISTSKTDTFTTASTSFVDVTGLTVTITPQSATSKILVLAQVNASEDYAVSAGFVRLARGATAIDIGDTAGSRTSASFSPSVNNSATALTGSLMFLDSPATTSATTYAIQVRTNSGTFYVNRSKTDSDNNSYPRLASTITVMEISA